MRGYSSKRPRLRPRRERGPDPLRRRPDPRRRTARSSPRSASRARRNIWTTPAWPTLTDDVADAANAISRDLGWSAPNPRRHTPPETAMLLEGQGRPRHRRLARHRPRPSPSDAPGTAPTSRSIPTRADEAAAEASSPQIEALGRRAIAVEGDVAELGQRGRLRRRRASRRSAGRRVRLQRRHLPVPRLPRHAARDARADHARSICTAPISWPRRRRTRWSSRATAARSSRVSRSRPWSAASTRPTTRRPRPGCTA